MVNIYASLVFNILVAFLIKNILLVLVGYEMILAICIWLSTISYQMCTRRQGPVRTREVRLLDTESDESENVRDSLS